MNGRVVLLSADENGAFISHWPAAVATISERNGRVGIAIAGVTGVSSNKDSSVRAGGGGKAAERNKTENVGKVHYCCFLVAIDQNSM